MNVITKQYHVDTSNALIHIHTHTDTYILTPNLLEYIPVNGKFKKMTTTKKSENIREDSKGSEEEEKLYHIWEYKLLQ